MRNTQNLSIIRSEPPPAIGDETTWSLSGAAVGFISWLLALGIPFLLYGSNRGNRRIRKKSYAKLTVFS